MTTEPVPETPEALLSAVIARLRAAGLEFSSDTLADTLWLAARLPHHARQNTEPKPAATLLDSTSATEGTSGASPNVNAPMVDAKHSTAEPAETDVPPSTVSLYAERVGPNALPVRVMGAPALPNSLQLARALKAFRRRMPSRRQRELDEAATVDFIARTDVWMVVHRPRLGRWLDLALVIDGARSMMIWEPLVKSLRRFLRQSGTFGAVSTHTVECREDGRVALYRGYGAARSLAAPHIPDLERRLLVVVLTDATSQAWHRGQMGAWVGTQARSGPVALLQLLPAAWWPRTALRRSKSGWFRSVSAVAPNASYVEDSSSRRTRQPKPEERSIAVPVLGLDPLQLEPWARAVTGQPRYRMHGVRFRIAPPAPATAATQLAQPFAQSLTAAERVAAFDRTASTRAKELAPLLSVAPLTFPIMRLLMQIAAPQAELVDLAEVLYSGLVRFAKPAETGSEQGADTQLLFHDGVRELLLAEVPTWQRTSLFQRIAARIGKLEAGEDGFSAWVTGARGGSGQLFIEVEAAMIRRFGGSYAGLLDGSVVPPPSANERASQPGIERPFVNPTDARNNPQKHDNYLLVRPQYALSYNSNFVRPNWVSWHLTRADLPRRLPRAANFAVDHELPTGFRRAQPEDYRGTAYDRGHLCPPGDRAQSEGDQAAVFLMSNVVPQRRELNARPWADLERYCQDLAQQGHELLICAGASGAEMLIGDNDIAVPKLCWKVVAVFKPGEVAALERKPSDVICVLMPQGASEKTWRPFQVQLSELEAQTGTQFPKVWHQPPARTAPEAPVAPTPSPHENGYWVLVDGSDRFELAPTELALARELGTALALAGFSLITFGTRGVAHVVGEAFWRVLQSQGYHSGIYRILHLVERGGSGDIKRGRAISAIEGETRVSAAVWRAQGVFSIGESSLSAALETSARGHVPFSALQADEPHRSADAVASGHVAALLARLPPLSSPASAELARLAAQALDQTSRTRYNERLEGIRSQNLQPQSAPLLLFDRRASHRLLAYLIFDPESGRSPPGIDFATLLLLELGTTRALWETRTLWLALTMLERVPASEHGPDVLIALACIDAELRRTPGADDRHDCRDLIQRLRLPLDRARQLAAAADKYESVRQSMRAGTERTVAMSTVRLEVGDDFGAGTTWEEARTLFAAGRDGQRVVALVLMASNPESFVLESVNEAIVRSRSAFEQQTALLAIDAKLPNVSPPERDDLRKAIEDARERGSITPQDPSRWTLSSRLLETLSDEKTTSPEPEPRRVAMLAAAPDAGEEGLANVEAVSELLRTNGYNLSDITRLSGEQLTAVNIRDRGLTWRRLPPRSTLCIYLCGNGSLGDVTIYDELTFLLADGEQFEHDVTLLVDAWAGDSWPTDFRGPRPNPENSRQPAPKEGGRTSMVVSFDTSFGIPQALAACLDSGDSGYVVSEPDMVEQLRRRVPAGSRQPILRWEGPSKLGLAKKPRQSLGITFSALMRELSIEVDPALRFVLGWAAGTQAPVGSVTPQRATIGLGALLSATLASIPDLSGRGLHRVVERELGVRLDLAAPPLDDVLLSNSLEALLRRGIKQSETRWLDAVRLLEALVLAVPNGPSTWGFVEPLDFPKLALRFNDLLEERLRFFNPPEDLPRLGRRLKARSYVDLVRQLEPNEALFGLYDRGQYQTAPRFSTLGRFKQYEEQPAGTLLGYFALPFTVAEARTNERSFTSTD